jgi:hypothetical protein
MGICNVTKKARQTKKNPEQKVVESDDIIFPDMPEWEGRLTLT